MKLRMLIQTTLFVCFAISALPAQPMMRTPAERSKQLKERLALNEEQTQSVEKIFEKNQKETREKMEGLMGDREAMRALMTEQASKTDKEIEKLLTEEQKKKYEELKKERQQRRRGPRSN